MRLLTYAVVLLTFLCLCLACTNARSALLPVPAPQQAAAPQPTAKPASEPPGNNYTPENAIDLEKPQIESWAEQGVFILRGEMKDPTAFTLLQVIARTQHLSNGKRIVQYGYVHYISTNSYGGRSHSWGKYEVKRGKGGKKDSFYIWAGEDAEKSVPDVPDLRKNETEIDVTEPVKKFLSEHPYK